MVTLPAALLVDEMFGICFRIIQGRARRNRDRASKTGLNSKLLMLSDGCLRVQRISVPWCFLKFPLSETGNMGLPTVVQKEPWESSALTCSSGWAGRAERRARVVQDRETRRVLWGRRGARPATWKHGLSTTLKATLFPKPSFQSDNL